MSKEELISILDSDYKDYFEDIGSRNVFLLSKEKANTVWKEVVDFEAKSYFNLPDDNWIATCKSASIGEWITSYNDDERKPVSDILRANIDWAEDLTVRFFVNRDTIFQLTWSDFIDIWDDFIAVEDDCPLIIPVKGKTKGAILFRPIGDIHKIDAVTIN